MTQNLNAVMLDPTAENQPEQRPLCDRPATLQGLTVGLLDISKPRGNVFLDHLETLLSDQGAEVRRYVKPTFAKPAPVDLRHEIATSCHAVIEALAA